MVQFPPFASDGYEFTAGCRGINPRRVSPFGNPWIEACLAAPQGLSQLAASFIASRRQGIHRLPLIA